MPLKVSGFAYPDLGDLNRTRDFISEAEFKVAGYKNPYHVQARLLFSAYGQTPFDPDSTEGKVLGPPGGRYQDETGGGILMVERDLRNNFRFGLYGRLMHSVTYSGGSNPDLDPHATVFHMESLTYGSGGLVLNAGDDQGWLRGSFEWGGIPGARKPFFRSRGYFSVRLVESKPGNFTVSGYAETVHGEAPYLEAVMVGGRSTLRGYPTRRFLGDQGAGVSFQWDSLLLRWKQGRLRVVLFSDIARAWNRGLWERIGPPPGEDWGKSLGIGLLNIGSKEAFFPRFELDAAVGRDPWPGAATVTIHVNLSPWGEDPLGR